MCYIIGLDYVMLNFEASRLQQSEIAVGVKLQKRCLGVSNLSNTREKSQYMLSLNFIDEYLYEPCCCHVYTRKFFLLCNIR